MILGSRNLFSLWEINGGFENKSIKPGGDMMKIYKVKIFSLIFLLKLRKHNLDRMHKLWIKKRKRIQYHCLENNLEKMFRWKNIYMHINLKWKNSNKSLQNYSQKYKHSNKKPLKFSIRNIVNPTLFRYLILQRTI